MTLQVTLVKTPGNIALPRNNYSFDQRGGTFGRADSNTWVLPDPEKFLSSCHCAIVFADGQFYLEDKSTNGTFVNGGFEPLGRGVRHAVRDGDFFEIGDYRFSIKLDQQKDVFASPFDVTPAAFDNTPLFGGVPKPDFFGTSSVDSSSMFDQQQDPLALWDNRPQPQSSPFDGIHDHGLVRENNSLLDDFVGLGGGDSNKGFSAMDLAPAIDQAVTWPTAKSEALIPEDWDDLLGPSTDSLHNANKISPTHSTYKEPPSLEDFGTPFSAKPAITQGDIPFDIPTPAARVPLAERILGMEIKSEPEPQLHSTTSSQMQFASQQAPVAPAQPVTPQRQAPELLAQPPQQAAVLTTANEGANQVLIDALGLDASRLSEADKIEISRITGQLMREIVDGMLGVLRSRASIKNEFRMNVTTIQPVENNPLKFSVCVDDALENLFIKKSNAYKKPVEAFREGFQEIAEHQLAMIAGIRQGFEAMMERFNPEHLEKTFSKQVKGSVIPGMQKAKFWSSYAEYYQGFSDNMDFSFQHLFGSDFVTAYEDQLRRLAAARKRGESNE